MIRLTVLQQSRRWTGWKCTKQKPCYLCRADKWYPLHWSLLHHLNALWLKLQQILSLTLSNLCSLSLDHRKSAYHFYYFDQTMTRLRQICSELDSPTQMDRISLVIKNTYVWFLWTWFLQQSPLKKVKQVMLKQWINLHPLKWVLSWIHIQPEWLPIASSIFCLSMKPDVNMSKYITRKQGHQILLGQFGTLEPWRDACVLLLWPQGLLWASMTAGLWWHKPDFS